MNIYIRKNNNDLFKYLTKEEIESLPCQKETIEFSPQEHIDIEGGVVNIVKRGIINIISQKTGNTFMTLSEGEIFGEERLFQDKWSLNYQCETQTVVVKHFINLTNPEIDSKIKAKINAALNDSLSEKLIRLSQD